MTASTRASIEFVLKGTVEGDVVSGARRLLSALAYGSERTLGGQTGRVDDFVARFPAERAGTAGEQAFLDHVTSVHILFQLTDDEVRAQGAVPGLSFGGDSFEKGNARSFIFVAAELNHGSNPRGRYAQLTREVNKRFASPTIVVFRAASRLTLAFADRRPHKRDEARDVLGSVSLIREIDAARPHRAHVDTLAELALTERLLWMDAHRKPHNFDGLLAAWLVTLDTEELNRRFYGELFSWFSRALKEARFPTDQEKTLSAEEHVIRLITRLLFIWFMKEKGLIADELFVEARVAALLRDYDRAGGDSYYRAVLQNLFFATLNTEIGRRDFSTASRKTHRSFSLYRYRDEMGDPDALLRLFDRTPFINGGLFDCLDSEESTSDRGYRIDCFSDNRSHRALLSVPNRLFFDAKGLIVLFDRYKFTVEENTPTETDVALDPELLGKAFENLLAAYNPETRETARKQTGSYYTPRAVVDYMVDEALTAALAAQADPDDGDADFWAERLRYLLDFSAGDATDLFTPDECDSIVRAISRLKVLDPAVGSGAFPMAVLHKLTLALARVDGANKRWRELQREHARARADEAFETPDQARRDAELLEISDTFERYSGNFGRKIYLIQNSIFGVDIQTVACQIAKLRFFISLAIEQTPDTAMGNFGIKPLPNLETRFVAADTLLCLEKPDQLTLSQTDAVKRLESRLNDNRERHFHAILRDDKLACRKADRELRLELSKELTNTGLPAGDAERVAHWDPYDQNATADWFDAEYMFGVADGFDVVIGNPPYVQLQKNGGKLGKLYKDADYVTFTRTGDVYQLFCERGCRLLRRHQGLLVYITSNSWLKAEYGKRLRHYFAENHTPLRLLEMGKDVFNAIVDTSIVVVRSDRSEVATGRAVDLDRVPTDEFPPPAALWGPLRAHGSKPWISLSDAEWRIMEKMEAVGTPLKDWDISIYYGIKTGYNPAFIVDDETRASLIADDPKSSEILKPILRGRDIKRYRAQWAGLWLINTHNGYSGVPPITVDDYPAIKSHLDRFYTHLAQRRDKGITPYNLRNCVYHAVFKKEKVFWMHMSPTGRFAYSARELYCNQKAFVMTGADLKYLCAVLNSSLIAWFVRNTAVTTGMGLIQWDKFTVEKIPVPDRSSQMAGIPLLVNRIRSAKAVDQAANTDQCERDIDRLVYSLYKLTEKEIESVEEWFYR